MVLVFRLPTDTDRTLPQCIKMLMDSVISVGRSVGVAF